MLISFVIIVLLPNTYFFLIFQLLRLVEPEIKFHYFIIYCSEVLCVVYTNSVLCPLCVGFLLCCTSKLVHISFQLHCSIVHLGKWEIMLKIACLWLAKMLEVGWKVLASRDFLKGVLRILGALMFVISLGLKWFLTENPLKSEDGSKIAHKISKT